MNFKAKIHHLLLLTFLVFLTSCDAFFSVQTIQAEYERLSLALGETRELDYSWYPSFVSEPSVFWSSSNPGVVSVNQEGVISAISLGKCLITLTTDNGLSSSVEVATTYPVMDYLVEEIEPNNGMSTANPIVFNGTTLLGYNSSLTDFDYFLVNIPENSRLFVSFVSEFRMDLEFYRIAIFYNNLPIVETNFNYTYVYFDSEEGGNHYIQISFSEDSQFDKGEYYALYFVWF
jgi:hypothetical protein